MKVTSWAIWIFSGFGFFISNLASAQFFEIKVVESKIYRLSLSEVKKLGFSDLTEVAFYGYPGMLPQKLDSAQLQLQEIPSFQSGESLFVFLQGPHLYHWKENGEVEYSHHIYSDSLSYLIGKKSSPKRIQPNSFSISIPEDSPVLYKFVAHKEEKVNILNSGKKWYSNPIRQGQSLNINFRLKSNSTNKWIISGEVMGQSTSASTMRILTGDRMIQEIQFSPIPNSTYGVKGDEQSFLFEFNPESGQLSQLRFTTQGTSQGGHLDYVVIGTPYSQEEWSAGVFEQKTPTEIPLPQGKIVWEVSEFYNPKIPTGNSAFGKKWAIFSESTISTISNFKSVNLGLRSDLPREELLIISASEFLSSAQKLKLHKENLGISTRVVNLQDIYNSFGYGNQDLTAIRNFISWDFHSNKNLKNVLILGKGTFDYKGILGGRPNLVPMYTSRSSLNPLTTYSSDDYFALVDWGQGEWVETKEGDELLQIGIGRIPAISSTEANNIVEKIIRYETDSKTGSWKRNLTFVADDGDNNIHLRDGENLGKPLTENQPDFLIQKQYLDRFEQVSQSSSQSSPEAKKALAKALEEGTLLVNFIGHGNETTLTAEEIFKVSDIENWPEMNQLPIWMTATCEFGRSDSPFLRSAAEELLLARNKGAVALLSTGRPVFSSVNFSLNKAFMEQIFQKVGATYQDLGSIYKNTKNSSQNGSLNRNFSLIGDPSLSLPLPELDIKITELKAENSSDQDTLKAFQEIQLKAEIRDPIANSLILGFNGEYQIEVFDKPVSKLTLGNESPPVSFKEESNLIFKGKGEVKGGLIESKFFVSQNIDPSFGEGRIRIYAIDDQGNTEAMGTKKTIIGGQGPKNSEDLEGPEIQIKINDSEEMPFLFSTPELTLDLRFKDESGINFSTINPDQLLSYQINDEDPIFAGNLLVSENGDFKTGSINTKAGRFKEGMNLITIHAWDNLGNGSTKQISLEIKGSNQVRILSHKVYPNPSSEEANFQLTHNRPGENLILELEIFSLEGKILFSESVRYLKAAETIKNLSWKFFQNLTKYPAKGTYIYKLALGSESDFTSDQVSGKLVIE